MSGVLADSAANPGCTHSLMRAVEVTTGIRDSKWTEMIDSNIKVGDELVIAKKQ